MTAPLPSLVPKLHLGTSESAKLYFLPSGFSWSSARTRQARRSTTSPDWDVTKYNLVTRRRSGLVPNCLRTILETVVLAVVTNPGYSLSNVLGQIPRYFSSLSGSLVASDSTKHFFGRRHLEMVAGWPGSAAPSDQPDGCPLCFERRPENCPSLAALFARLCLVFGLSVTWYLASPDACGFRSLRRHGRESLAYRLVRRVPWPGCVHLFPPPSMGWKICRDFRDELHSFGNGIGCHLGHHLSGKGSSNRDCAGLGSLRSSRARRKDYLRGLRLWVLDGRAATE